MKKNIRTHTKKKKALALLKDKRLGEARDLYAEVCKIDPVDAESWFRLGTINIELKAMARAEGCFRRVVELEPRLASAYYNLGRSLELQAKDEEAIAVYWQLLQMTPHIEAYFNIATIYVGQGKFTEALEAFRQAQQIEPNNARLIAGEAGVYEKQGDYEAAYARIKPLLDAGQATPEIAIVLAAISQRLDRRPQAIELLENQLGRYDLTGNTDVLIPLHFELARLLDAAGDYDRAFHHARLGNNMTRSAFDHQAYAAHADAIMEIFSADFMRRAPRATEMGRSTDLYRRHAAFRYHPHRANPRQPSPSLRLRRIVGYREPRQPPVRSRWCESRDIRRAWSFSTSKSVPSSRGQYVHRVKTLVRRRGLRYRQDATITFTFSA